jgi:flagellar motor switch protein FliN/FliY
MTAPAPPVFQTEPNASVHTRLAEAAAAAAALAPVLPAGQSLVPGEPTVDRPAAPAGSQAACAHYAGAATGEIVVVIGADLIEALRGSSMGELDPAKALQPALAAALAPYGPVVVDPAVLLDAEDALATMAQTGQAVYVPLLEGTAVRAVLALVGGVPTGDRPVAAPSTVAAAATAVPATFPPITGRRPGLDLLHDVEMEVTAELGRTRMTVRELLSLAPGTIVELDRAAGSPADLLVNGRAIAVGEVVIIDENFGLRITAIIAPGERG